MTDKQINHENLAERDDVKIGGDRTFGFVFAIVFVVVALLPVLAGSGQHDAVRVWALVVAAVFAITALARPQILTPLNKTWLRFGHLLHKIVNPLIMGVMFFLVITPIGLVMRSLGKKPLKTGFDKNVGSYWTDRVPPGPDPDSMKRQFQEIGDLGFIVELWLYIKERKKFWLLPIMIMTAVFGGLVVLSEGSAVAPFIYTIFQEHEPVRILGVSAFYHDSAGALIEDGQIIAAAQEERFTRKKHDSGFPGRAISYCLEEAGISLKDVDFVAFYDKPFLKFERLLETYLSYAPKGFTSFKMAMPLWIKEKLFQKDLLKKKFKAYDPEFDWINKLLFSEHHFSHAASAFFPSPYEDACVLTMDGVGEWATTSVALGHGNQLEMTQEIHFPHSLGLLYSALTYYTGFKVNSGEYKVMGLAPYGEPKYAQLILDNLIDIKEDGSFRLDQRYFDYCSGLTMTNRAFDSLFGGPPRRSEELLTQRHMDLAASVQAVTEEVVLKITRALATKTGQKNLCLAGGVALNCVANGKVVRDGAFENLWVQPAAGDAGGALGAALAAYHVHKRMPRNISGISDSMKGSYLGPGFSEEEIQRRLSAVGAKFESPGISEMIETTAQTLAEGKAVGWFQGRMEFGPRALGGRSFLGDARSPEMQRRLNLKVKYRESFRPFAPSVLREDVADWFEHDGDSPYMLIVADVVLKRRRQMNDEEKELFGIDKLNVQRSDIPAVTHVDYSARIQTVHEDTNPPYHALINRFKELTGCPVIVNTSFNVRGEPIVCTPEDAFKCFMGTETELLVVGNSVIRKENQDPALKRYYKDAFELD